MFDLQLIAGRNLYPSDPAREIIVNETFARKLNLPSPQELIGRKVAMNGGRIAGHIVDVVKDFHDQSFHEDINAVLLLLIRGSIRAMQ